METQEIKKTLSSHLGLLCAQLGRIPESKGIIVKSITGLPLSELAICVLLYSFPFYLITGDQCERVGQKGYQKSGREARARDFSVLRLCGSVRQCHVFWSLSSFSGGLVSCYVAKRARVPVSVKMSASPSSIPSSLYPYRPFFSLSLTHSSKYLSACCVFSRLQP